MNQRKRSASAVSEILNRLTADLIELSDTANELKPSAPARRQLDAELRDLIIRAEALLRDLDPIHQPRFMFDPGDPAVVGRFIALAMIAQTRSPLSNIERFYGYWRFTRFTTKASSLPTLRSRTLKRQSMSARRIHSQIPRRRLWSRVLGFPLVSRTTFATSAKPKTR